MVGQTVGKYRIVSRLGRGGMGTVYKAVDETLDREVAVKCLNADIGEPDLLKRFRAEAIALARLNHPNIATLFELATHDGQFVMVMEFVRGDTFDRVLQREGSMPVARAAQLCAQVLDALEHAHRAGIVHRDLKPANLMLTQSGLVKVMDFGLARMMGTEHLTTDGYMVGTPAYMSPEQVLGREIDGRADLYAMGVVLFRLLTSQLPFKADSGVAMVHHQLNDPPTPIRQLRSELPEACEQILTRALSKAADDRFQTADEFRSALTRLDPAIPLTGVSRISAVAPVVAAEPDLTLPPPPTPPALPASAPSSVTLVLPPPPFMRPASEPAPVPPALNAPPAVPNVVKAAPAPPPVTRPRRGRMQTRVVATIAGAAVLAAGIPITGVLWWRAQRSQPSGAPPFSPPAVASATSSAPALSPASTSVASATAVAAAVPASPPPSSAAAKSTTANSAEPEPARPAFALVTFSKIKLLVLDEHKARDLDALLRLGAGGLEVVNGTRTLESTAYPDVIGVYYSHSKEPRWTPDNGQPTPVMRTGGSLFGFLKGTPDWITVRTRRVFIPLRVDGDDVPVLTRELEARTGNRVVTIR
jgi:serine/threonine protein kinase